LLAISVALQANSVRDLVLNAFDIITVTGDVDGITTARLYVNGDMNTMIDSDNFSNAGVASFN